MKIHTGSPLTVLLVFAAAILAGYLVFRFAETPFMRLRARWYPSARPGPELAAAA